LVRDHYGLAAAAGAGQHAAGASGTVPWIPYNFHAGNYCDPATGYSPQDVTTAELLASGITPMPNWVFSPKFALSHLKGWVSRQIDVFERADRQLHQIRIKNPGHGNDWTVDAIWAHAEVRRHWGLWSGGGVCVDAAWLADD
jgi:hypothetical protein